MKQLYTLIVILLITSFSYAQTHVTADPAANWSGYMAWFNHTNGVKGDNNMGGDNWGLADLKTTVTASGDTTYSDGAITLQPNFNLYGDGTDSYWADGANGNKFMEGTSKVEIAAGDFTDGALSFAGSVASNTIDAGYTVVAFIKTLDPSAGYATIINQSVTLGATGTNFAVSANDINSSHIVQYGFTVSGMNANPAEETALGSVIITPTNFGSGDNNSGGGDSGTGPDTAEWDFENAADVTDFPGVGDGTHTSATVEHVTTGGNTGGALRFGGANDVDTVGKAYQVQYSNGSFDYGSAASAKLTFDMKIDGSLSAAAVFNHFETKGGGTKTTNNLEAPDKGVGSTTLNNSTYTSFEVEATGLTGGTGILRINFQISAGAVIGGGGILLVDNVKVELFDSNGDTLGFVDLSDSTFVAYPNPVQNTLNVSAGVSVDQVSIFDLTGREVMRATPNASAFSLDVTNLNKGLYLVSLKAGDQEMTTKLVK